jgi:hypothetical protein
VQIFVVSVSNLSWSSGITVCCIVLISLFMMFTVLTVLIIFHQLLLKEFFLCTSW